MPLVYDVLSCLVILIWHGAVWQTGTNIRTNAAASILAAVLNMETDWRQLYSSGMFLTASLRPQSVATEKTLRTSPSLIISNRSTTKIQNTIKGYTGRKKTTGPKGSVVLTSNITRVDSKKLINGILFTTLSIAKIIERRWWIRAWRVRGCWINAWPLARPRIRGAAEFLVDSCHNRS